MKYGNRLIKHVESNVFHELVQPKYGLKESEVSRLSDLYANHDIYYVFNTKRSFERFDDMLDIDIRTYDGTVIKKKEVDLSSKVLDFVPYYISDEFVKIRPVLCIEHFSDMSLYSLIKVIVHEVCHLYSLGYYHHINNDLYVHNFGLNRYVYCKGGTRLIKVQEKTDEKVNEIVNDCISCYICEQFLGRNTESIYSTVPQYKACVDYIAHNINLVIEKYFSDEADTLLEMLPSISSHGIFS